MIIRRDARAISYNPHDLSFFDYQYDYSEARGGSKEYGDLERRSKISQIIYIIGGITILIIHRFSYAILYIGWSSDFSL